MARITKYLKLYFTTGLLVIAPLGVTIYIVWWVINFFDSILPAILPNNIFPKITGVGILALLLLIMVVGAVFTTIFGRIFWTFYEEILHKLPFLRGLYSASKQIFESFLSDSSNSFKQVVLVEYPRKGLWTMGFVTANPSAELRAVLPHANDKNYIAVYVPTTPNPSSGFLLFLCQDEYIELDISVDEAIKQIISLGIVKKKDKTPDINPSS